MQSDAPPVMGIRCPSYPRPAPERAGRRTRGKAPAAIFAVLLLLKDRGEKQESGEDGCLRPPTLAVVADAFLLYTSVRPGAKVLRFFPFYHLDPVKVGK